MGACALASEYADDLVVGTAREVHTAIADRCFTLTDRATAGSARLPRMLHDGICRVVYTGVGGGLRAVSSGFREAERRGMGARLEDTAKGRFAMSVMNGLIGDRILEDQPDLAISMAVRVSGQDVSLDPPGLARVFPDATADIVVFLHGLSENEEHWNRHRERVGGSYGDRLAAETSWTPVYLRANTGTGRARVPRCRTTTSTSRSCDSRATRWTGVGESCRAGGGDVCSARTRPRRPWKCG